MADNLQQGRAADRLRINVHEEYEVKYWTKALGIDRATLVKAVESVGVMAEDVREYLARS